VVAMPWAFNPGMPITKSNRVASLFIVNIFSVSYKYRNLNKKAVKLLEI